MGKEMENLDPQQVEILPENIGSLSATEAAPLLSRASSRIQTLGWKGEFWNGLRENLEGAAAWIKASKSSLIKKTLSAVTGLSLLASMASACAKGPVIPPLETSPRVTEVSPPPTTEPTVEPTKEPTPDVFKHLEGATATPSANGKSWNIKLENGRSFEVADPERDIKIDNFGVWKILDKDGLLIYVFDPGIKHYDGTYTEAKGWIDATTLSPVDSSTFPKAYTEIVSNPGSSTETEQNDYQDFLNLVRTRFLTDQGIMADVKKMVESGIINPDQKELFGMFEWIQQNLKEVQDKQIELVIGPKEIRDSMVIENENHFETWRETWVENGISFSAVFGWEFNERQQNLPDLNYQTLSVFNVDIQENYSSQNSVSGIFGAVGSISNGKPDIVVLAYMLKDRATGRWFAVMRSASFDPNFYIPAGTSVQFHSGYRGDLTEDIKYGPLMRYGEPWSHEEVWNAVGKAITSKSENAFTDDWTRKHITNQAIFDYPYGMYMTGDINLPPPRAPLYPKMPWANVLN